MSNWPAVESATPHTSPRLARDRPERRVEAGILELSPPPRVERLAAGSSTHGRTPPGRRRARRQVRVRMKRRHRARPPATLAAEAARPCRSASAGSAGRGGSPALEQVAGGPVDVQDGVLDDDARLRHGLQLLGRAPLGELDDQRSDAAPEPVRVNVAVGLEAPLTVVLERGVADDGCRRPRRTRRRAPGRRASRQSCATSSSDQSPVPVSARSNASPMATMAAKSSRPRRANSRPSRDARAARARRRRRRCRRGRRSSPPPGRPRRSSSGRRR